MDGWVGNTGEGSRSDAADFGPKTQRPLADPAICVRPHTLTCMDGWMDGWMDGNHSPARAQRCEARLAVSVEAHLVSVLVPVSASVFTPASAPVMVLV